MKIGYGDIDCDNIFSTLSIPRIVSLFMDVMQERKIVVHSNQLGKVSSAVRTIAAFLYPFKWQVNNFFFKKNFLFLISFLFYSFYYYYYFRFIFFIF